MPHPYAPLCDAHHFARASYIELKLTEDCNLKCDYCCVSATPIGAGRTMTLDTHARAAAIFLAATRSPQVNWCFHGGEPLLLGETFFREAVAQVREVASGNPSIKRLRFTAQTNGTMVNEKSLRWLDALKVEPLLSFDGLPEINQAQRGGTRTTDAAIRLLRARDPEMALTCVLTPQVAERFDEVIDYLAELGIRHLMLTNMEPVGYGEGLETLPPGRNVEVLRRLLDRMLDEGPGGLREAEMVIRIEKFAVTQLEGTKLVPTVGCRTFNCFGGYESIAVDPSGTIHPCGRAIEARHWALGNVNQASLVASTIEERLANLHEKSLWFTRCVPCDASRVCAFSCAAYDRMNATIREEECATTKVFFRDMLARKDRVMAYFSALRPDFRPVTRPAEAARSTPD